MIEKNYQIDYFYAEIFLIKNNDGKRKHPNLAKLLKSVLCIAHGNADAERDFSLSAHYLLEDRASMSEKTLHSAKTVKDALRKFYKNKPENVLITEKLIKMAKLAHKNYKRYLQEEKGEKKIRRTAKTKSWRRKIKTRGYGKNCFEKKSLIEQEQELNNLKRKEAEKFRSADFLLKRANQMLQKGVGEKNFNEIEAALALMKSAEKSQEELAEMKKMIGVEEKKNKQKKIKHFWERKFN